METNALVGRSSASDVWMRGLFMLLLMIGFGTGQWLLGRLRAVFRRELGDDAPERQPACECGSPSSSLY